MSKRKSTRRAISTEEAWEAIKAGRYDLAGVFQIEEREISKFIEQYESLEYVPLAEFLKLLTAAERQVIERLVQMDSAYTTGIPFHMAKALLMSLLRIPPVQREVTDPPSDKQQTDEEMDQLRKGVRAAAKVASEVRRRMINDGAPPSLEAIDSLIEEEAKSKKVDKERVRELLEAARDGDPPVTLGDNKQLPVVAKMPDSLHSNKQHEVIVTVNGGLRDPGNDVVLTVTAMMNGGQVPAALEGLINKPVASEFVPDKKGKLRRTLLSAQLTEKSLPMTIEVDRAFRPGEWRHNRLTICKLHSNPELAAAVVEVSSQLQLDFDK
jgi:hypothetical protein